MIQFYAPDIAASPFLPENESIHCSRVLRKQTGDKIYVTDGKGQRYLCEVLNPHPKHTEVKVIQIEKLQSERDYSLILAVAPTKNSDRIEWMLEKAIEVGVDKIIFLRCDRSERKTVRLDRLYKIAISAMNQSLSVLLPEIEEITSYKSFIESFGNEVQKFFGYCSESFPKREFVKECKPGGRLVIMIGPEGDFTENEVEEAVKCGFIPVTFGNKRLRTETAGVYAVCAVNVINQLNSGYKLK